MMLGFGDATTASLVTLIGGALIGLLTVIGRWLVRVVSDRIVDEIAHRVGTPNGHGNAIQMLERLTEDGLTQDRRINRLEDDVAELRTTQHTDHAGHEDRIGTLEQEMSVLRGAPCFAEATPTVEVRS